MRKDPIKIAIIEDHHLVRKAFRELISQSPNLKVVFDVSDSDDLFQNLDKKETDVLLLDIFLPKMSGKEIMMILRERYRNLRVVVVSFCVSEPLVIEMLELGALAYLSKATELDELIKAIETVCEGKIFKNEIAANSFYWKINNNLKKNNGAMKLSDVQIKILQLLWQEKNNQEIADEIFASVSSVEKIKQSLKEKLGVKSNVGLVKYALDHHIIIPEVGYPVA
ncbi:MAG TPA: response regulator transcription factor [Puia sp.]|uniref:response regulator transcription factor n=1 Tax=Puia sp. TaxID=2045100 RepID=UPI002BD4F9AF|nr:response regulator transcription factor [Puia sp.]HVU94495.1 response regulator transcription factor [Puia sp.]